MNAKWIVAAIAAVMTVALHARKFDVGALNRTMEQVQRTASQIDATVQTVRGATGSAYPAQTYQPSYVQSYPAQTYQPTTYNQTPVSQEAEVSSQSAQKAAFREHMGSIAQRLNMIIEWIEQDVVNPVKAWIATLDHDKGVLLLILIGIAVLIPMLVVSVVSRKTENSLNLYKGSAGCSALAGVAFTILYGFEVSGTFGEWLAGAVMAFMGLSFVLALIGGLYCGKSIVFKAIAPFMMLEMSLVVFAIAIIGTIVFIVIVAVMIALAVFVSAADTNTVYRCSNCGRVYNHRPSSCSCGARFD